MLLQNICGYNLYDVCVLVIILISILISVDALHQHLSS